MSEGLQSRAYVKNSFGGCLAFGYGLMRGRKAI
jgi:hypothetical protein